MHNIKDSDTSEFLSGIIRIHVFAEGERDVLTLSQLVESAKALPEVHSFIRQFENPVVRKTAEAMIARKIARSVRDYIMSISEGAIRGRPGH